MQFPLFPIPSGFQRVQGRRSRFPRRESVQRCARSPVPIPGGTSPAIAAPWHPALALSARGAGNLVSLKEFGGKKRCSWENGMGVSSCQTHRGWAGVQPGPWYTSQPQNKDVSGGNSPASDAVAGKREGEEAIHGSGSPGHPQSCWRVSSFPQSRDTSLGFLVVSLRWTIPSWQDTQELILSILPLFQ